MAKYSIKKNMCLLVLLLLGAVTNVRANDGYKLWLEYNKIANPQAAAVYKQQLKYLIFPGGSDQLRAAKTELLKGLESMLSILPADTKNIAAGQTIIIGTPKSLKGLSVKVPDSLGSQGYLIKTTLVNQKKCILITAKTDAVSYTHLTLPTKRIV